MLLTYGYHARDISIMLTNTIEFDNHYSKLKYDPLSKSNIGGNVRNRSLSDENGDSMLSGDSKLNVSGHSAVSNNSVVNGDTLCNTSKTATDDSLCEISLHSLIDYQLNGNQSTHSNDISNVTSIKPMSEALNGISDDTCDDNAEVNSPSKNNNQGAFHLENRRLFEDDVKEHIADVVTWNNTPQKVIFDSSILQQSSSSTNVLTNVSDWIINKYKKLSVHIKIPQICHMIITQCIPELLYYNKYIIDITLLHIITKKNGYIY